MRIFKIYIFAFIIYYKGTQTCDGTLKLALVSEGYENNSFIQLKTEKEASVYLGGNVTCTVIYDAW